MADTLDVIARRWKGGWELEIDPDHITQSRTLSTAPQQIRDYLDTFDPATNHDEIDIVITPEIGDLSERVRVARQATLAAARAQAEAASQSRAIIHALKEENFTGREIAQILGVTPGRVSQLIGR